MNWQLCLLALPVPFLAEQMAVLYVTFLRMTYIMKRRK